MSARSCATSSRTPPRRRSPSSGGGRRTCGSCRRRTRRCSARCWRPPRPPLSFRRTLPRRPQNFSRRTAGCRGGCARRRASSFGPVRRKPRCTSDWSRWPLRSRSSPAGLLRRSWRRLSPPRRAAARTALLAFWSARPSAARPCAAAKRSRSQRRRPKRSCGSEGLLPWRRRRGSSTSVGATACCPRRPRAPRALPSGASRPPSRPRLCPTTDLQLRRCRHLLRRRAWAALQGPR
mmetsp:Transcript_8375/g.22430  ORF Transcript_8375/g.22430 Transcript_8375/m.22430 type:complete len:235 (-) Transcript_8375:135-839(-)